MKRTPHATLYLCKLPRRGGKKVQKLSPKQKKYALRTYERVSSGGEQGNNKTNTDEDKLHTPWVCEHVSFHPQGDVYALESSCSLHGRKTTTSIQRVH